MPKENKNKNNNQNRCRRCDRPLKDPTVSYGWRCAEIVGVDPYSQVAPTLDGTALEEYNAYVVKYLFDDTKRPIEDFSTVSYNYDNLVNSEQTGILDVGYDENGVWHDWDAENFGADSSVYKMLTGLNTAYERANIYGHWSGDKERIEYLANTLRVTDTRITDVILLNNSEGAKTNGHTALLLMNSCGQGFYFSYSAANGYPKDIGEMRFSVLSANEVNEIKDRSGEVYESVTIYGDRRWETGKDAYDRFVWCDVPDSSAGERMFHYAADVFTNPGKYKLWEKQCDYIVSQILSAGGIEYEKKLRPNDSFEVFRNNKTYWQI